MKCQGYCWAQRKEAPFWGHVGIQQKITWLMESLLSIGKFFFPFTFFLPSALRGKVIFIAQQQSGMISPLFLFLSYPHHLTRTKAWCSESELSRGRLTSFMRWFLSLFEMWTHWKWFVPLWSKMWPAHFRQWFGVSLGSPVTISSLSASFGGLLPRLLPTDFLTMENLSLWAYVS